MLALIGYGENNNKGVSFPADKPLITSPMCTRHDNKKPPAARGSFYLPCASPARHPTYLKALCHAACYPVSKCDCA